jgi:hypothetical protein
MFEVQAHPGSFKQIKDRKHIGQKPMFSLLFSISSFFFTVFYLDSILFFAYLAPKFIIWLQVFGRQTYD